MSIENATGAWQWRPARWRRERQFAVGTLALLVAQASVAFELEHAAPLFTESEYRFEMIALLDAPIDEVERILRDYENYPALDSRILEAKVLERPEDRVAILATTLRACFGPVCRTVRRVERVEESPHALLATTDPMRSDMRFGETRTELADAEGGQTRVTYRTRLQPDFWIPALVARRMMLETLEDATIELFRSVEKQAQSQQAQLPQAQSQEAQPQEAQPQEAQPQQAQPQQAQPP